MRAVPLETLADGDFGSAGGKARGLALLMRMGMAVPRGWAVFGGGDGAELAAAWRAAGSPPVAVRSSAAREDGAEATFAGQFRTVLGVRDAASLERALAEVLASQAGPTAYGEGAGGAAAVVQEMLDPECAGVAFGRDPAGGAGVVVEAVAGLGDALVSGKATPERWRVTDGKIEGTGRLVPAERLRELAAAVLRAGDRLGGPQDVEWAVAQGRLWLLQARPARPTAATIVADLRARRTGPTAWSATYNLAETLPDPTPMSWAFARLMMSWEGGYGRAIRRFGLFYRSDVREHGFLELAGGRLYADLEREAASSFGDLPMVLDFDALRQNPALASRPVPRLDLRRGSARFWLRFPWYLWRLVAAERRLRAQRRSFPSEFDRWEQEVLKRTAGAARAEGAEFVKRFERVATESAEMAIAGSILSMHEYEGTPAAERGKLRSPVSADILHRGPGEMELARPRWREMPAERAKLPPPQAVSSARTGLYGLRERGKDLLMRETEVLRLDLLEIGRRTGLGADVFFLTPAEIARPDAALAARRRTERAALLRIPLPAVIFSSGEAPPATASATLSPGNAEGVACHPDSPAGFEPPAEAVLVLPSLDPAWTLYFGKIRGVVVEKGGLLSHGAIVARELGVPCVCVPDARRLFPSGRRLRISGEAGTVEAV